MRPIPSDSVPLKRPHFEPREGKLFFLRSTRPFTDLDEVDHTVWSLIDGVRDVATLQARVPDVQDRLRRLWALGVVELAEGRFPTDRRRIVVVEPHMDDAVLSVGGLMWALRHECEFVVVTVADLSNFTSYYYSDLDFFEVDRVSALRKAESDLVMRLLGGRHVGLGEPEAPLRCRPGTWSRAWYRDHTKLVSEFVMSAAADREVSAWSVSMERFLSSIEAAELWLPLGVGSHTDHELTRDAYLEALVRRPDLTDGRSVYLYQDVPYAVDFPTHTQAIVDALTRDGARLVPRAREVEDALAQKQRLVSIYASQFKADRMAPRVAAAARLANPSSERHSELLFALTRCPTVVDRLALYSGRDRVEALIARAGMWRDEHRTAARIRVLSAVPLPRWWTDDVEGLLRTFPHATLEVHVRDDHVHDAPGVRSPRVDMRPVRGGRRAWLARLARCCLETPAPTLLLTGTSLQRWGFLARAAFPRSDLLSAGTMSDAMLALQAEAATGP